MHHDLTLPPSRSRPRLRPRNDPGQYDDLVGQWWKPRGAFAALHWLATERARLVPPAARTGALLLDIGCGGGLLAPHVSDKGYRHLGVDLGAAACAVARTHGVVPVRADAAHLPVADGSVDVVVAGEVLEHVSELGPVVAELARVLRPGGTLVVDTLADTLLCRVLLVHLAERLPFVPRGIHDPALFVDPDELRDRCRAGGIELELHGLRPNVRDGVSWLLGRTDTVRFGVTRSRRVVIAGRGVRTAP